MKISFDKVKKSVDKIGFSLVSNITIDVGRQECCPIAAIILAENKKLCKDVIKTKFNDHCNVILDKADDKFGVNFVLGFLQGFDGDSKNKLSHNDLLEGWENGRHIRNVWMK